MHFVGILVLILVATMLAGHFAQRLDMPGVVGQLLVGIVLGPAVLGWIHESELVNTFSEIGVIILMFMAGLESNLKLLKRYLKPALIVAFSGVIAPIIVIGGVSLLFGISMIEALFIGVIFSATSVSISVEVLKEFQTLDTKEGTTILGAAVVDDILGVLLLSVMIAITGGANQKSVSLPLVLLEQLIYFIGVYLVVRWAAPYLMNLAERMFVTSGRTVMSLIICLGMAWTADLVGLSGAIGAFFAGIAVSLTDTDSTITEQIEPIGYGIFIPVFFVSVGLGIKLNGIGDSLILIIVLTILAVLTKLYGGAFGALGSGFDWASSQMIGAGMISRGEMALITLQIGYAEHLLNRQYYSAIVLIILLVTIVAPIILKATIKKQPKVA